MRTIFLGAAALLLAGSAAGAQNGAEPARQSLTISLGAIQENRRDDADSPLAYSGRGPGALIEYDFSRAKRHWHISFGGGGANLVAVTDVIADVPPKETFNVFTLSGGMDWMLRGGFAVGFDVAATATLVRHIYEGQALSQQNFDFGEFTIAPIARWNRRLFSGELTASLAVPLISGIDHPYADVRFANQFSNIHFAPLSQFRQLDGAVSYAFASTRRTGVTVTYHIDAMQLDERERVRRVGQTLSVGVVRRLGVKE